MKSEHIGFAGDEYNITITTPSEELPLIDYGRHFTVNGSIGHTRDVPDDAVLTVRLLDRDGNTLRYAAQEKKNNSSVYVYHPSLTAYEERIDPGREQMKKFGFAELMVRDLDRPEESLRDATIKCWYSDDAFKSMIVSASDVSHGAIFDDGIGFTDENGQPYTVLQRGEYTVVVTLCTAMGEMLAGASKKIVIGNREEQVICRFNPRSHRLRMTEWCREMGISITNDVLPGYLDPYMGTWLYHMGLLTMYRANDITFYTDPRIHMFVYLIDPTSTSYETELAFLQTKGYVGDPDRFVAYRYDIGEAVLKNGTKDAIVGKILKFAEDEFIDLYRIDVVNERAQENVFDLNEEAVISFHTDLRNLRVHAGDDIAFTGVVKPWQLDKKYFTLRKDNTYAIGSSVNKIKYVFDDGALKRTFERTLLLERIDGDSIGFSVYEFYNIFHVDENWKGKTLTVEMTACDADGENPLAKKTVTVTVL